MIRGFLEGRGLREDRKHVKICGKYEGIICPSIEILGLEKIRSSPTVYLIGSETLKFSGFSYLRN